MTPRPARLGGAPVRALLVDYGDTLVDIHRPVAAVDAAYAEIERRLRAMVGGRPVPAAAALQAGVHDRVDEACAAHLASGALREIDLDPVYRLAYADLIGAPLPDHLLLDLVRLEQRAWFHGITPFPEVPGALGVLRRAGIRLGICSNAPYMSSTLREQIAHVGLAALVDSITLSSEVGWRKPSRPIFDHALGTIDATPAETAMVGDLLREDVGGAQAAGMRAIWIRRGGHDDGGGEPPASPAHHGPGDVAGPDATIESLADLVPLLGLEC